MQQSLISLRDALETDLPAILEIYNDIILTTTAIYSEEPHTLQMRLDWFNERKQAGFPVIVAEQNGVLVGFATYGKFRVWPCYRFTIEHSLYVHRDNRGQGISKILLQEIISLAKSAGMHALIAGVDSENDISLQLHLTFGFTQVARFKEVGFKFNRWLDLIFLEMILE
ncbi:GNAT family N-acetyltransferase [Mucilaginibacter sp. L196]|uniref:GNAT family N-acetyltransferase n=1 Tax=Mucilaginibacter sp. L196 TaxID=1641870 RepID=UPI00131C8A41|nr:GNAT family N-acetyltransferase [Mucilaginibacter sp. L196]